MVAKNVRFNDLFKETSTQTLMNLLNNKSEKELKSAGLNRSDLSNEKFRAYLQQKLPLQIDSGLKKLWDINVGEEKYDLLASNLKAVFNLDTRAGYKLGVNTYDMDAIIKDMLPIIQEIDPNFVDKVKKNIENKCKQQGIDTKTFCFNSSTKDAFEKLSGKSNDEKIQSPVQNKEDDHLDNSENTELLHSILGKKDNSSVANVNYGGKNVRFNDLFISTASKTLIDKLQSKSEEELRKIGLKRDDLANDKFDVFVQKQLRTKIMTGLNGFGQSLKDNNKDGQKTMFDVNTRAGYSFAVTLEDMESIIRSMKPIMKELGSSSVNKAKEVSVEKTEYVTIKKDVIESAEESTEKEEQIDDSPELKSPVTASQIKELSNNNIAFEKISRIISTGVYEKDGVKIELSQEQKLELSNILKQASKVQQEMKDSQQLNSARTREESSISNIVEKGD